MSPVTLGWAMLLSLLPARYRAMSRLDATRQLWLAAIFCSSAQVIIFSFIFVATFINESTGIWEQASEVVLNNEKGPEMDPVQVRLTTGVLGLTAFTLRPVPLSLAYMAVEGAMRAFMAVAMGTILPTLPLGIVAAVHGLFGARKRREAAAVLAIDIVEPARDDTYDWHVLSAQPKREWGPYTGIQYKGELYLLDGEQSELGLRPFGYRLRKNPPGNLLVVVSNYDPSRASSSASTSAL
jgi:hypothetical protein